MKILFCPRCNDVFTVSSVMRQCLCGDTKGWYIQQETVEMSEGSIPLGLVNDLAGSLTDIRPKEEPGEVIRLILYPKSSVVIKEVPLESMKKTGSVSGFYNLYLATQKLSPLRDNMDMTDDEFTVVQHWEGKVEAVSSTTFYAKLVALVGEGPDQIAELNISDVHQNDWNLITPGSSFDWILKYYWDGDNRVYISSIKFRNKE